MTENPKSARDTNIVMKWKRILKVREMQRNDHMTEKP